MNRRKTFLINLIITILFQIIYFSARENISFATEITEEEEDTFYINSIQEFYEFAEQINSDSLNTSNKTYFLTTDIVLESNNTDNWTPIKKFKGVFDGQGHSISGLYFSSESFLEKIALFEKNDGIIKNLNIKDGIIYKNASQVSFLCVENDYLIQNCNIINSTINVQEGSSQIGGICSYNGGYIEYCSNSSNITSKDINAVGGVVGENYGFVRKSNNFGTITGENNTNYNNASLGGVVGSNHGIVKLSFNKGKISGNESTGGIVGSNFDNGDDIMDCYNFGTVSGNYRVGGIVGTNGSTSNVNTEGASVKNSYNIGIIKGNSSVGAICGYNSSRWRNRKLLLCRI